MRKLILGLLPFMFWACSDKKPNTENLDAEFEAQQETSAPEVSQDVIEGIIQQIPSPLEISFLLKDQGVKYNNEFLNDPKATSNYNSDFQKAINLGIYGTDLGYTNIYEQNQDAIYYLQSIQKLSEGLNIGQFFNFKEIKRLATNSSNLDSLLLTTTKNFNSINAYLQQKKRANLSVLLLTGGWLEALHITTKVAESDVSNQGLIDKIGEQKIILDQVKLLLDFYKTSDPNIGQLRKDFEPLIEAFNQVEFIYTYHEPEMKEVDGEMVIIDNSTTEIKITPEILAKIGSETQKIRANVTK
ncbi:MULTISPECIES: hypothetical protein [Persicobacter]|uniref:Uncharacterized protein n=1 Tax=Persicobacter diffluens TaxID=981 RepID=A0AAN4VW21_9BACT|nr:hypothetical protein [Persicobacter sp. CCB-QB2]GJM60319.1 hypothetical protein PEDI_08710 [Persicobacter diffluens]